MAKRKKQRIVEGEGDGASRPAKPPPVIGTSLRTALAGITLPDPKVVEAAKAAAEKLERDKAIAASAAARAASARARAERAAVPLDKGELGRPSDALRGDERFAYFEAIAGVRPLKDVRPDDLILTAPKRQDPAAVFPFRHAQDDVQLTIAIHVVNGGGALNQRRR